MIALMCNTAPDVIFPMDPEMLGLSGREETSWLIWSVGTLGTETKVEHG